MSAADPFGLVGQVLDGQFRVDKLVGEGGFSAVYRGHHQGLNEPIAIKCLKLPPSLGTSLVDTFVQRFRDESRILYRLSQGNLHVVRSIAAGTTQAPATGALVPYMVLEWLEGRSVQSDFTVRRTVGEKGRTIDELVKLFDSAADGLAYAHAQGVVHRDLNPGNLFLANTQQGVKMKVLDFGVAKLMHDGALNMGPRAHTVGQIKIFAPAYGAPEQFDDRIGAVGAASDVYSFALILLEALRDKNVVEGTHLGEFAQTTCDPRRRPTPRFLGVDVPDEIEQAFVRATALDPKERWHSAGDFWKSLTIAWKHAIEDKNEQAARETPSLGLSGAAAPSPVKNLARTMPLGASTPGLPAGFPRPAGLGGRAPAPAAGASRPRVPTTIGIPAPASGPRTGAVPSPNSAPTVPAVTSASTASSASTVSGLASTTAGPALAPPAAPPRTTARPPPTPRTPNMPAMPAPPRAMTPFPPRPAAGTAPRTPSDRPGSATDRPAAATARFPSAVAVPPDGAVVDSERPAALDDDDDDEQEEATKVHAPAPEVLRTLALHDAATARAAAQAKIAAHQAAQAEQARAAAAPAAEPATDPPRPITPVPPSLGGTLMMAPAAHVPAPPPKKNLNATMAMGMMPPLQTPGLGFIPPAAPAPQAATAPPAQAAPPPPQATPAGAHGTQGMAIPYGHGSAIVQPAQSQLVGAQSQVHGGQSQIHGGQSQVHGGQSQMHGGQSQIQSPQSGAAAPFGPGAMATYGRPSTEQPFAAPSLAQPQSQPQLPLPADGPAPAPARPLPIVPIAIGLAALALGGLVLGFFALRARGRTPVDPTAISSSDVPSASAALTVPVVPDTPPDPTVTAETDAAPAAAEPETEDASATAAADAAAAAASASAALVTAPPTATSGPVFTWPPPTASAPPAPSAKAVDPNAFSESAARSRLATANGVLSFCKKEGGVTGSGNASITFANDGSVAGVALDPPFAGTKEGDCVSAQFRRAKVSPFTGPPQTVRHGFEVPK